MCFTRKMCYICLGLDCKELTHLSACDANNITYAEKLKNCLQAELQETDCMEICKSCVQRLDGAFNFMALIRHSQEMLHKQPAIPHNEESKLPTNNETNYDLNVAFNDIYDDAKCDNTDDAEKPQQSYNCDFCDLEFPKRWQLQKHKQRVHLAEKKYTCSHCNKAFKQSYHLAEHVRAHTGEKIFSCTYCDKKFHRISSQRRHIRSHESVEGQKSKRTPFLCTICGKSFPFSNGVQRHMRVHLGIKKHECKICNKRFNQSTHLQVHMRTHTGEKPYICHSCGEAFSLNATLQKHMLLHKDLMMTENMEKFKV